MLFGWFLLNVLLLLGWGKLFLIGFPMGFPLYGVEFPAPFMGFPIGFVPPIIIFLYICIMVCWFIIAWTFCPLASFPLGTALGYMLRHMPFGNPHAPLWAQGIWWLLFWLWPLWLKSDVIWLSERDPKLLLMSVELFVPLSATKMVWVLDLQCIPLTLGLHDLGWATQ